MGAPSKKLQHSELHPQRKAGQYSREPVAVVQNSEPLLVIASMGITAKGYRRVYDCVEKRSRMEHDLVWEHVHGPIPAGFFIHHVNHNKLDNRIDNLELIDPLSHKRHHSGC